MDKWEYLVQFVEASIEAPGARAHLAARWPGREFAQYDPCTLLPHLEALGEKGWELVSLVPVAGVGGNGDVLYGGHWHFYSNTYLAVFKRRRQT